MFGMGHWEILIILVVILLVFGAKRIPEMAQGLGKGIREFRGAMREVQDEIETAGTPQTTPPPQQVARGADASANTSANAAGTPQKDTPQPPQA